MHSVYSEHFFGGTITWQIENITNNGTWIPVRLTQTYWWLYSRAACTNISIATNQPIGSSLGYLSCSPSCPTNFGPVSTLVMCKDASVLENNAVGERSDVIWTPVNSTFSVKYANSAWGGLTLANGGSWSISSYINLVPRSDNGLFNNAPKVALISPIHVYLYQQNRVTLSVYDVDGDDIRCRWASSNNTNYVDECAGVCSTDAIPEDVILYSNCIIEIQNLSTNGTFAFALMVEDFIDTSSSIPMSSVSAQFIVHIIPSTLLLAELIKREQKISVPLLTSLIAVGLLFSLLCGFCLCRYFQYYAVFARRRRRRTSSYMYGENSDVKHEHRNSSITVRIESSHKFQYDHDHHQAKADEIAMEPISVKSMKDSIDQNNDILPKQTYKNRRKYRKVSLSHRQQQGHVPIQTSLKRRMKRSIRVEPRIRKSRCTQQKS